MRAVTIAVTLAACARAAAPLALQLSLDGELTTALEFDASSRPDELLAAARAFVAARPDGLAGADCHGGDGLEPGECIARKLAENAEAIQRTAAAAERAAPPPPPEEELYAGEDARAVAASRAPPLALAGYVLVLASAYGGASLFLAARDAALFNLSLLTSDAYAAAFAAVVARRALPLLYFVAFAVTALGLGMYHTAPPPTRVGGAPPLEPLVAECPPRQTASERL